MDKLVVKAFESSSDFNYGITMDNSINHQQKKHKINRNIYKYGFRQIQKKGIMGFVIPKLSQLSILRHERATLIDSSTIAFGNESMRLVNIVFHTSKMFPSIMGTSDRIGDYLQKELQRKHPKKHFHIIIGEDNGFSFAISHYSHFADIKQEQYRVLIFSTERNERIKMNTYDANSQMKLQWKSVVIKKIDN